MCILIEVSLALPLHSHYYMMKHSYVRSFHASHQLNLQPMDNEREYLPWMSDSYHTLFCCSYNSLKPLLTKMRSDLNLELRSADRRM